MEDTRAYQLHWSSPDYEPPPECQACGAEIPPNTGAYCPVCAEHIFGEGI
jgi:predicted amidophosphoribosyltransferase